MQDLKAENTYRALLKERILDTARELFTQHGIKAVKMDDIAQRLGISKRTLYEIYEDKEKLVYMCIVAYDQKKRHNLEEYAHGEGHNVIDIIVESSRQKLEETRRVNPLFYEDIIKYPAVEQYIKEVHERTREGFQRFMQRGICEGCLRPDINYDMIPHLIDSIGLYIMNSQLLRRYTAEELFSNLFLVMLRGLCTAKGLQLLETALSAKIQKTTRA